MTDQSNNNVTVPTLSNLTEFEAQETLKHAGLKVGKITKASSLRVSKEKIISTTPAGGASVLAESAVDLEVSSGPPVSVPDLVGLTRAAAEAKLKEVGLTVGPVKMRRSDRVASG